ncbi:Histone-like bacterial DNA-binding protein [gut metagenome]|uniref:Histone-like bacterial DNA-binding protein n=1 Tax=gut metagenome TaxID=749906 RepID=J9C3F5_9ZZZZ
MNNKDFINALASRADLSAKATQQLTNALITGLADKLNDETSLTVQGFGAFEVKKKLERIAVNPATQQRKLVPPRLVLAFKPSNVLKDKLK